MDGSLHVQRLQFSRFLAGSNRPSSWGDSGLPLPEIGNAWWRNDVSEEQQKKRAPVKRPWVRTNFYPTYTDGGLDRVNPVQGVARTNFQRVIPYYDLSMTGTRDSGTGPMFLEVEYHVPSYREEAQAHRPAVEEEELFELPRHKRRKVRTDFWG